MPKNSFKSKMVKLGLTSDRLHDTGYSNTPSAASLEVIGNEGIGVVHYYWAINSFLKSIFCIIINSFKLLDFSTLILDIEWATQ